MKKVHFIGIGGIGMSAIARILLEKGIPVSGSDQKMSAITEELKKSGAEVFEGHHASVITPSMTIVYSTGINEKNPEFKRALELGNEIVHRSEMLRRAMEGKKNLLVTGTHGKTTTSSLLAYMLYSASKDPSFAIGGIIQSLGSNGREGRGDYFVAEADESDGSFLNYPAYGAIITNLERDHMNYWLTEESLFAGFKTFADNVEKLLFWCHDDPHLQELDLKGYSYGFHPEADASISSYRQEGWHNHFDLRFEEKLYQDIRVNLIGKHNALNAAAVFALGIKLGIDEEQIRSAFLTFQGIARRVEKKGMINGVEIYDDYGHHPTEIETTISAIKSAAKNKRVVVAFQPHRYSRLSDLFYEFGPSFKGADLLILTDIYSAGEEKIEWITIEKFHQSIETALGTKVIYAPFPHLIETLKQHLRQDDVLLMMGAGNITEIASRICL